MSSISLEIRTNQLRVHFIILSNDIIFECKHRNVCNQLGFIGGKYKMKQYEGQRISLYKPITDAMTEMFQLNLQEYDIINDYSYIATRFFLLFVQRSTFFDFIITFKSKQPISTLATTVVMTRVVF